MWAFDYLTKSSYKAPKPFYKCMCLMFLQLCINTYTQKNAAQKIFENKGSKRIIYRKRWKQQCRNASLKDVAPTQAIMENSLVGLSFMYILYTLSGKMFSASLTPHISTHQFEIDKLQTFLERFFFFNFFFSVVHSFLLYGK